jgi:hypothetical protein
MKKALLFFILLILNLSLFAVFKPNTKPIILDKHIQGVFLPSEVLKAIIWVETGNKGKGAYNRNEPLAVGILQEFPIIVRDVNRILGYRKYKLEDRLNPVKAIEMFWIYQKYYNPEMNLEKMCRIWCGGPDGDHQKCTLPYLNLVKTKLYENNL